MSPITILAFAVIAAVGVALGYYLRLMIAASKKGSIEVEIKQMMLDAKERAKKLEEEAAQKAEDAATTRLAELKEKEDFIKKAEHRMLDKEALLDNVLAPDEGACALAETVRPGSDQVNVLLVRKRTRQA